MHAPWACIFLHENITCASLLWRVFPSVLKVDPPVVHVFMMYYFAISIGMVGYWGCICCSCPRQIYRGLIRVCLGSHITNFQGRRDQVAVPHLFFYSNPYRCRFMVVRTIPAWFPNKSRAMRTWDPKFPIVRSNFTKSRVKNWSFFL